MVFELDHIFICADQIMDYLYQFSLTNTLFSMIKLQLGQIVNIQFKQECL
jgi:hypothetical protein